ncbi:MAG: serpin family protein [Clostridiales bacterium]|nr:serpin family protein [Clostridiales bacterium]
MKTKRMMAALLTSSLLLSMAGCAKKEKDPKETKDPTKPSDIQTVDRPSDQTAIFELTNVRDQDPASLNIKEIKQAYSKFVFGVMKRCLKVANGNNVMISSDSILFALEMAASGADGDTLDQMLQTMMPGVDNQVGFQYALDRMKDLQSDKLSIANSAWINKDLGGLIYDDYLSFVKGNFDAEIQNIKFDDSAVATINNWVCEKTDGMIEKIIDDVQGNSLMMLINAITFDAKWAEPFEEHRVNDGEFTTHDGTTQNVTFLHGGDDAKYLHSDSMQGIMKYYEDGDYAFVTLLPDDESVDINDFMQNLSEDEYWDFWESRNEHGDYNLIYKFPEFKSEYGTELGPILKDMGMEDAFEPGKADFSNLGNFNFYIGKVIHKTYIDVNRAGTRAAAVTVIDIKVGSAMAPDETRYVMCDRPFAYAIVDTTTGLPVFLGTVESVN